MKEATIKSVLDALTNNPEVTGCAITGSLTDPMRRDSLSDLDLAVVVRNRREFNIRNVQEEVIDILLLESHLDHYFSLLTKDFERIDLGVFEFAEFEKKAVLNGCQVVKGDESFRKSCEAIQQASINKRTSPPDRDVNLNNIVFLLIGGAARARRGELLSASTFLQMAIDMIVSLKTADLASNPLFDPHNKRRHLEVLTPELANKILEIVSVRPDQGIFKAKELVLSQFEQTPATEQALGLVDGYLGEA